MLVGHRPVVHLATSTVVGWRLGRTRVPGDPEARAAHLRRAVDQMAQTLLATDEGHHSMRFAVIEASITEAADLVGPMGDALDRHGFAGSRFGVVFSAAAAVANPAEHEHLGRLAALGVGVTFDIPDPGGAIELLRRGLPVVRLRMRIPADDGRVEPATATQLAAAVELARRQGIATSVTAIDTPAQEAVARWAGADVGTGDQLAPVSAAPVLDVRRAGGTLATVQRLTDAVHGRRDHAWAPTGT